MEINCKEALDLWQCLPPPSLRQTAIGDRIALASPSAREYGHRQVQIYKRDILEYKHHVHQVTQIMQLTPLSCLGNTPSHQTSQVLSMYTSDSFASILAQHIPAGPWHIVRSPGSQAVCGQCSGGYCSIQTCVAFTDWKNLHQKGAVTKVQRVLNIHDLMLLQLGSVGLLQRLRDGNR